MTALLVAGRRPGVDPLAAHFGVADKALIEIAGEPMLSRVARLLAGHPAIARIVVLAQEPDRLMQHAGTRWMLDEPCISGLAGGNSVSGAVDAALAANPGGFPFVVTTADNVLLDAATLQAFIDGARASAGDVAVGLVPRSVFRTSYPDARRTWLKFRGEAYSGANLFFLANPDAANVVRFWRRIEAERKRGRAVARAFGLPLLAAFVLRILDVRQAIGAAGRKLGVAAQPIELRNPDACIDVDSVADHALVTDILANRAKR